MHTAPSAFFSLLLITTLAVAVPIVVSRFRALRLPIVVGEIIAGIIIGRSGLNLVERTPTLDFLAEFGFALLMFLSGFGGEAAPSHQSGGQRAHRRRASRR